MTEGDDAGPAVGEHGEPHDLPTWWRRARRPPPRWPAASAGRFSRLSAVTIGRIMIARTIEAEQESTGRRGPSAAERTAASRSILCSQPEKSPDSGLREVVATPPGRNTTLGTAASRSMTEAEDAGQPFGGVVRIGNSGEMCPSGHGLPRGSGRSPRTARCRETAIAANPKCGGVVTTGEPVGSSVRKFALVGLEGRDRLGDEEDRDPPR